MTQIISAIYDGGVFRPLAPVNLAQGTRVEIGVTTTPPNNDAITSAIERYQSEELSIGQLAELLSLSVYETQGLLKERGVPAAYSLGDLDRDRETMERLLNS